MNKELEEAMTCRHPMCRALNIVIAVTLLLLPTAFVGTFLMAIFIKDEEYALYGGIGSLVFIMLIARAISEVRWDLHDEHKSPAKT